MMTTQSTATTRIEPTTQSASADQAASKLFEEFDECVCQLYDRFLRFHEALLDDHTDEANSSDISAHTNLPETAEEIEGQFVTKTSELINAIIERGELLDIAIVNSNATDLHKALSSNILSEQLKAKFFPTVTADVFGDLCTQLELMENGIDLQIQKLKSRKARLAEAIKLYRESLALAFVNRNVDSLIGTAHLLILKESSGRVQLEDTSQIPEDFVTEVTTLKYNKVAIKAALESGQKVDGVSLSEPKRYIQFR